MCDKRGSAENKRPKRYVNPKLRLAQRFFLKVLAGCRHLGFKKVYGVNLRKDTPSFLCFTGVDFTVNLFYSDWLYVWPPMTSISILLSVFAVYGPRWCRGQSAHPSLSECLIGLKRWPRPLINDMCLTHKAVLRYRSPITEEQTHINRCVS